MHWASLILLLILALSALAADAKAKPGNENPHLFHVGPADKGFWSWDVDPAARAKKPDQNGSFHPNSSDPVEQPGLSNRGKPKLRFYTDSRTEEDELNGWTEVEQLTITSGGFSIGHCIGPHTVQLTPIFNATKDCMVFAGRKKLCFNGQFTTGRYSLHHECVQGPWFQHPHGLSSLPTLRYVWDQQRSEWVEDRFETVYVKTEHPNRIVFIPEPPAQGEKVMYRVFEPACIEYH